MHIIKAIALATVCFITPALAAPMDFVTDPALCPLTLIERHEKGMSFDGRDFWEIEYHCAIETPITRPDWKTDMTEARVGYCEEPGAVFPDLFVFRSGPSDPGLLFVYQGDSGEAFAFHLCTR